MGEGAGSDTSTIRVQKQAARRLLNALPDVVRIAYGWLTPQMQEWPSDGPQRQRARDAARRGLVEAGYLTDTELDELTVWQATTAAVARLRVKAGNLLPTEKRGRRRRSGRR